MRTKRLLLSLALCALAAVVIHGCGKANKRSLKVPQAQSTLNLMGARQGHVVGFVDMNGDGTADKVVGAPYAATSSSRTGAVLVYEGSTTGFSTVPAAVLTGDDNLGYSFTTIGNDFAFGAIHGDGDDVSLSGSVTIYQGGGNGTIVKKLSGEWPLDKFGFSLASGDLNGDGSRDLIVGAPFNTNDPALYQGGAVYVFFGPGYATRKELHASASNTGLGWAVAAGDVNGDGTDDLLVPAKGKLLVFYGNTIDFSPSIDAPDSAFTSTAAGFGKAVAVIGDIDGVPGGEIAIGSPNAFVTLNTVASRDAGSVVIVNMNGAAPINLDTAIAGPAGPLITRLNGETLFSRFGSSVIALGDINGGGKPDLAVGSPMRDVNWKILSGTVYVFKGENIAVGTPWADLSAFEGEVRDHSYGASLAASVLPAPAGTMNAVLIGAPLSHAGTGGTALLDLATGSIVPSGSSGGSAGSSGDCH